MNIGTENETTEFKESMTQLDKGVLSLTAMLNRSNEGTVYFGVDDNGEIIGLAVGDSTLEKIRNAIRNDIQPRILADTEVLESDDGKKYISVHASGYEIPYSYDGRYYVRHGSSNETASPDLVAKMVLSRGYDAMREMESYEQNLTFHTLNVMLESHGLHPRNDSNFFNSIGLLTKGGVFNYNAMILADKNDLVMQIVEFQGETRAVFSKRRDYGGQCMFRSMELIFDAIQSRNETKLEFSSGRRIDLDLFDLDCVREAWYNACLHNRWYTGNSPVLMIFDDRIEIQSYGSIPYGIPMDDLYEGRSSPVNESLFKLAMRNGFVENTGHGIPTIISKYGKDAINATGSSVTITIPFAFEPTLVTTRKSRELADKLDEKEFKVLDYLKNNQYAKISEISKETGLNESSVKRTLSSLKTKGVLENRGTNRNSIWVSLI